MKFKIDLHGHTNLDPSHGPQGDRSINYSYVAVLDRAKEMGLSVMSFTHHGKLIFTAQMKREAAKRGILLLPGFEAVIGGADVIIINPSTDNIHSFAQLAAERKRNSDVFVLAPHPFYPGAKCLGHRLIRHIDLFDGVEYCHLHTPWFNVPNWIATWVARAHGKSLVATSDAHYLQMFGTTYSVVEVDLPAGAIDFSKNSLVIPKLIASLRDPNRTVVHSPPVPGWYLRKFMQQTHRHIRFMLGF